MHMEFRVQEAKHYYHNPLRSRVNRQQHQRKEGRRWIGIGKVEVRLRHIEEKVL